MNKSINKEVTAFLLTLISDELEIPVSALLSKSQEHKIFKGLTMATYILSNYYGLKPTEIAEEYHKLGWMKSRMAIYRSLSRSNSFYASDSDYRFYIASFVDKLDLAENSKVISKHEDEKIYTVKGRILSKLISVDNGAHLIRLEKFLDVFLKRMYIEETQYKKNEKEWLTTEV